MALSSGSLLAGRYEITAPIAVGGMGEVWRARDRVLGRVVAAKVLRSEYTGDPNFLARFRNEARHTAALTHPNIASVYDYGETRDENGSTVAYLVMEFVEGQTLVGILHEEGRLPVDWTLHVLGQAANGLSAAHRSGVVHRDIKPGNLIVRPDGVVKLTDFGIAQARDAAPLTRTGMVVGTAQYLSPEQAQGLEVTAASDVYSLGVVGYECLTGVRPFDGASQVAIALAHINRPPPPLPGDVPAPVRQLIARAMAKDAAERFSDGAAFLEAITAVTGGLAAHAGTGAAAAVGAGVLAVGAATEVLGTGDTGSTRVLAGTGPLAAADSRAALARPMPPLRARPDDDEVDRLDAEDPSPNRQRRWAWLLAGLVLLLALAALAFFLVGGSGKKATTSTTPPSTTPPSTAPATSASAASVLVRIDTGQLIGRDAGAVAADLTAQGLAVDQQPASANLLRTLNVRLAPNTVAGTNPRDESVPRGSTVVLYVARDGYTPPAASSAAATATATATGTATATATATATSSPPRSTPTVTSAPAPVAPVPTVASPPVVSPTGGGASPSSSAATTASASVVPSATSTPTGASAPSTATPRAGPGQ